ARGVGGRHGHRLRGRPGRTPAAQLLRAAHATVRGAAGRHRHHRHRRRHARGRMADGGLAASPPRAGPIDSVYGAGWGRGPAGEETMPVLVTVEAVAIVLLGLLVAGLLRSHAEILRALHDLGVDLGDARAGSAPAAAVSLRTNDADAHDVVGVSPDGDTVTVGVVGVRQPTLVAFLSSGCLTCGA